MAITKGSVLREAARRNGTGAWASTTADGRRGSAPAALYGVVRTTSTTTTCIYLGKGQAAEPYTRGSAIQCGGKDGGAGMDAVAVDSQEGSRSMRRGSAALCRSPARLGARRLEGGSPAQLATAFSPLIDAGAALAGRGVCCQVGCPVRCGAMLCHARHAARCPDGDRQGRIRLDEGDKEDGYVGSRPLFFFFVFFFLLYATASLGAVLKRGV